MFLANPNGKEIEEFMKTGGKIRDAMDVLYYGNILNNKYGEE